MKKIVLLLNDHLEEYCMAILLIILTMVMFLQIIMRFVFHHALSWPEEICRYIFVYITFLTLGYCIRRNSMLRLDVLQEMLPKKIWDLLQIIVRVLTLLFFILMLFNAYKLEQSVAKTGRESVALSIPYTMIYFSTILGFALAVIRSVQALIELFTHRKAENET